MRHRLLLLAIVVVGVLGVAYAYNVTRNVRGRAMAADSCTHIEDLMSQRLEELRPVMGLLFEDDAAMVEGFLHATTGDTCVAVDASLVWWRVSYGAELTSPGDPARREEIRQAIGRARDRCPRVYGQLLEQTPFIRDAEPELRQSATAEVCGTLTRSLTAMAGGPVTLGVWEWPEHLAAMAEALEPPPAEETP